MKARDKELEQWKAKREQEAREYLACPECRGLLELVAPLCRDEDGNTLVYMYQCPDCKTVQVKDQYVSLPIDAQIKEESC